MYITESLAPTRAWQICIPQTPCSSDLQVNKNNFTDPVTQQLKGQVPWEAGLEVQCKSKKLFLIHTPDRVYYLGKFLT